MNDVELALRDRGACDVDRIPTNRWPVFSTTKEATAAQGDPGFPDVVIEAERDLMLTDLSIKVVDDNGDPLGALVTIEYCDTIYADKVDAAEWGYCCDRKPWFWVGVRENKKLKFGVTLVAAAPQGGAFLEVSPTGVQGNGCCS